MVSFGLAELSAKPKIHCRRGEEERRKWRVPRAVKNVARDHEEIFPRVPGTHAPISGDDDYKKDDEGERIEKHARRDCLSKRHANGQYILPGHFADWQKPNIQRAISNSGPDNL
jgi:hypothetical protein